MLTYRPGDKGLSVPKERSMEQLRYTSASPDKWTEPLPIRKQWLNRSLP